MGGASISELCHYRFGSDQGVAMNTNEIEELKSRLERYETDERQRLINYSFDREFQRNQNRWSSSVWGALSVLFFVITYLLFQEIIPMRFALVVIAATAFGCILNSVIEMQRT
jgi:Flp pilus assembly protein TadB